MSLEMSVINIMTSMLNEIINLREKLDQIDKKLDNHKNIFNNKLNNLKQHIEVLTKNKPKAQEVKKEEKVKQTTETKTKLPKTKDGKPTSILNELRPGTKYVFEQTGLVHAANFCATVKVDGCTFRGEGSSKKIAKTNAAMMAVHFLTNPSKKSPTKSKIKKNKVQNPGMILNQLYPNAVYTCEEHKIGFKVTITIGEYKFSGAGVSKKVAKNAAAAGALARILTISKNLLIKPSVSDDQKRADYIGSLVHEKFKSVINNSEHDNYKVLSGIVMIKNDNLSSCKVITVNTGTKCILGEHISLSGLTLNDMHAEVLSRRGLVNFFYDQLDLIACSKQNESIFTLREDGKGYKLKDGIEFHLYINTAPCGDARIFCPHDETSKKVTRGQLRIKIEASEGTSIKNRSALQTWDGILGGENLLTMSCSDKICKWNVVGLQGALLSHFVEPIYLKSIVLGSLMHETHLYRAVCGRIENQIKSLPKSFQLNKPSLFLLTSRQTRDVGKSPRISINWLISSTSPEIVKTNTGKPESGRSQLCKKEFMIRFKNILGRIFSVTDIESRSLQTYCDFKEAATPYQEAKKCLHGALVAANLGTWISKPAEQDLFY